MITAGLIIFGALLFVLGVIVGSTVKNQECPCRTTYKTELPQCSKEMQNFLNYDGTEQE